MIDGIREQLDGAKTELMTGHACVNTAGRRMGEFATLADKQGEILNDAHTIGQTAVRQLTEAQGSMDQLLDAIGFGIRNGYGAWIKSYDVSCSYSAAVEHAGTAKDIITDTTGVDKNEAARPYDSVLTGQRLAVKLSQTSESTQGELTDERKVIADAVNRVTEALAALQGVVGSLPGLSFGPKDTRGRELLAESVSCAKESAERFTAGETALDQHIAEL